MCFSVLSISLWSFSFYSQDSIHTHEKSTRNNAACNPASQFALLYRLYQPDAFLSWNVFYYEAFTGNSMSMRLATNSHFEHFSIASHFWILQKEGAVTAVKLLSSNYQSHGRHNVFYFSGNCSFCVYISQQCMSVPFWTSTVYWKKLFFSYFLNIFHL